MKKILLAFCFSLIAQFSFAGTIIVQNTNNSGAGSLRDAVINAVSGDTIRFNPNIISGGSQTIVLTSELNFAKNLVFIGLYNASDTLYISGNNTNRIFYVDFTGSSDINKTITIDSMAMIQGEVSGNGGAIFFKHGDSLVIRNSVISRNTASSAGGAIYSYAFSSAPKSSIVTISNCIISGNTAGTAGGGIYSYSNSNTNHSIVTLSNSTIAENTATSSSGGGIYSYSNSNTSNFSTVNLTNCNISGNSALSGWGGGVYSFSNSNAANSASTLNVINCNIIGNVSHSAGGGGIYSKSSIVDYNSNAAANSTVAVTNSNISDNLGGGGISSLATSGDYYATSATSTVSLNNSVMTGNTAINAGGAIASNVTASYSGGSSIASIVTIDSCTISENTAGGAGGGIFSYSTTNSSITATNSTISGNSSSISGGGGIHCRAVRASTVTLNKSTVSENSAIPYGGGIYSYSDYAAYGSSSFSKVTLNESTVFGNTATDDGGGIYSKCYFNTSEVRLNNSTIYGNTAGNSGEGVYSNAPVSRIFPKSSIVALNGSNNFYNNSSTTIGSFGYNIFSNAPVGYDSNKDQINVDSISINLLPLAYNNGGFTQTMLPGTGSFAIDMGNPLDFTDAQNAAIEGIRDVGAAEVDCKSYILIEVISCESYIWPHNGQTYVNDTIIYDTLVTQNINGCDSILILSLDIKNANSSMISMVTCDSYFWSHNGQTYVSDTTVSYTIPGAGEYGCDSIVVLNLSIEDVTPPIEDLAILPDIVSECPGVILTAPTALDNCTGVITGTADIAFPITEYGATTVTWIYDDGNGNTSTQTQNVIIEDLTAPTPDIINLLDVTDECEVTPTAPSATDNCTGVITGTPNVAFPITASGTTTVTWIYDDGNGNTSTQTQNVIITPIDNGITQIDAITLRADAAGYHYQWVDCDNENASVPGATSQSFTPTIAGNYACEINNGTCTVITACLASSVGILENGFGNSLVVYPNPTSGSLKVELGDVYNGTVVKLFNARGQVVLNESFGTTDEIKLNIEGLSGLYILEIKTDEGKIARINVLKE